MTIIFISFFVFIVMLLFPFLFSFIVLKRDTNKELYIDRTKIKDPRYFSKSFAKKFEQGWAKYDGSGEIILSQKEKIVEADKMTEYPLACNSIVYAEKLEFRPPERIRFEKEIYSVNSAYLVNLESVRAIYCKKDLVLTNTNVVRWADADGKFNATNDCNLGISASSNCLLHIGKNCIFRRLYAPMIIFGSSDFDETNIDETIPIVDLKDISIKITKNIKNVNVDLTDDSGLFDGSIITNSDLEISEKIIITGHIRSHKSIRLLDDVTIYGNIFAEGDVYLGQNSRVLGSVFTQENLFVESGVSVGQPGKIKSIVARGMIVFDNNCRVYGYISSEKSGNY